MEDYRGYKEIMLPDEQLAEFYADPHCNRFELLVNEYLIVYNEDGDVVDQLRWDGSELKPVPFKAIKGRFMGAVKPRNIHQQLAIDMLYQPDITIKVLTGGYGVGKDMLMCAAALDLIERGKYDRIVWVRNNYEVKDTKPIGHLPGEYMDKLLPFVMPLADHLGGVDSLRLMMSQGKIEAMHLGFIRGRDICNSIIMCSESENLTKGHAKLLVGRVGEGSSIWFNGDYRQTDSEVFRQNNGLLAMIDRLKGLPEFGHVQLVKIERSKTAALADLLDD